MTRKGLILGIAIILVSNVWTLISAAGNRRGGAVQTIHLTERELMLEGGDQDNSSLTLRLVWRSRSQDISTLRPFARPAFDAEKLSDLGFDCRVTDESSPLYRVQLQRTAFVVLEYEGPAWEAWLNYIRDHPAGSSEGEPANRTVSANERISDPERGRREGTRLIVVDAGASYDRLREKYPESQKHLIIRARISAYLRSTPDPISGTKSASKWEGFITELMPSEIHVTLPHARELSRLPAKAKGAAPRYNVTLHYGRVFEPWIGGIRLE